jgi:hypothetical protein
LGDLIPVTEIVQDGDFSFHAGREGFGTEFERWNYVGWRCVAGKKQPPSGCRAAGEGKTSIDCMDRCSQWPDQERPCPTKERVERLVGGIVIALSAEGQLIALLGKARVRAMLESAA